jgi:hypothetical protein
MDIVQKPFSDAELEDAASAIKWISERHVACVFLLDTSGSMQANDAIGKLNEGLRVFKTQTITFDEHTKACIEVAVVSFGPTVTVERDFCPISEMNTPVLSANGGTPMGEALNVAMDMITERKRVYNENPTPYYRHGYSVLPTEDRMIPIRMLPSGLDRWKIGKGFLGIVLGLKTSTVIL